MNTFLGCLTVLIKSEHSLWVTVKKGLSCHTVGTCVLQVMWRIAGARSTRRLMAIHPGASRALPFSPSSNCSQQAGGEREHSSAHSSWMGTLYDNHHHFPSEDNTQRSLPELDCTATRAYGANFVWRVWWERPHAPLKLLNRPPEASRSLCLFPLCLSLCFNLLCHLFSLFPTCATNHLYGFPWHLLCFCPMNRVSKVHKKSMVTYLFILETHTAFPIHKCVLIHSRGSESSWSYFLFLH